MARRKRARAADGNGDDDVNLTPMLDVVFILLIFFIVTAQFIKEPGVPIDRQDVDNDKDVRRLAILVGVDEESKIFIAKKEVEPEEVAFQLRELRKDNPKGEIVVQVDRSSEAEVLVGILEAVAEVDGQKPVKISTERN